MKISSNICTLSSTFYLGVVVRLKSSAPILSQGCRCHIVTSYCTWCTLSTGHLHQCNYLSLMKLPSSIGRMVQVIIQQRNPLDKIFPVFGRPLVVPTVVQMWASYIKLYKGNTPPSPCYKNAKSTYFTDWASEYWTKEASNHQIWAGQACNKSEKERLTCVTSIPPPTHLHVRLHVRLCA